MTESTTDTTKQMIDVMIAFKTGEPIEYRKRDTTDDNWKRSLSSSPGWNWAMYDYRVAKSNEDELREAAWAFVESVVYVLAANDGGELAEPRRLSAAYEKYGALQHVLNRGPKDDD